MQSCECVEPNFFGFKGPLESPLAITAPPPHPPAPSPSLLPFLPLVLLNSSRSSNFDHRRELFDSLRGSSKVETVSTLLVDDCGQFNTVALQITDFTY